MLAILECKKKLLVAIMYSSFNKLLNSVCWYFVEGFHISIHKDYGYIAFLSWSIFIWLWHQECWSHGMS